MQGTNKIKGKIQLTDQQFDGLEIGTRRELIRQLMLIDTPKYLYSLGVNGNLWTLIRYDKKDGERLNLENAKVLDSWF